MIGSQYAMIGAGGFQLADSTRKIKMQGVPNVAKIDVSLATQFLFPSQVLNQLMEMNQETDQLRISSEIFLSNITTESILSLGNFENLFENYTEFVQTKTGHLFRSMPLFDTTSQETMRIFNNASLYHLLQGSRINEFGAMESALSGDIVLFDISRTLPTIRKLNLFVNSVPSAIHVFLPGDLIFVNDGFSIMMNTNVSSHTDFLSVLKQRILHTKSNAKVNMNSFDLSNRYTSSLLLRLV